MRDACTEEEAFAEFADYAMHDLAKAGPSLDVKTKEDDLGGYKKAHVSSFSYLAVRGSDISIVRLYPGLFI